MSYLNVISFFGIFGLCAIAWLFSEDRRIVPWRVIAWGIGLQLILGFMVFQFEPTKAALEAFSNLLNVVFDAAEEGARFIFGRNSYMIAPLPRGANACAAPPIGLGQVAEGLCAVRITTIFALNTFPAVIFFSGLMALLENIGVIKVIVDFFGWIFERTMRLSGAEALSGSANIFVGIEAAIVVKPYLPKMTRSELCAILACCFGTAASSVLAIYVNALKATFPNILGHLVSASIMAIPACFVLSKILVPETEVPVTMGGLPKEPSRPRGSRDRDAVEERVEGSETGKSTTENSHEDSAENSHEPPLETVGSEVMQRVSPLDAAILGALDGVKMSVSIAAVLILIVGLVYLLNQFFAFLGTISFLNIGEIFKVVTLANILGFLFYPLTLLTGVAVDLGKLLQGIPDESWKASVIIGRRLLETAIPPYQELGRASLAGELSPRTVLIVSYALSGFAHLASVGIFVGGTIALIPSRRQDISELGWKALFVGTLATMMIASVAGVFDDGNPSIMGKKPQQVVPTSTPSPSLKPTVAPTSTPTSKPTSVSTTSPSAMPTPKSTSTGKPNASPNPVVSPSPKTLPSPKL
ncbi:nucleoside transporter C-terminal domain-containing protein [Tumidithrix elongata RA019]|uniref:Nucleoside transporter C-terminal domain-containing protein n=1 Tax=Tumidithrix elongata BACA0141 TaxID=2716417 RepID=A0AAW9Q0F2_9CYAN|nr:nucleoside transporter C-terminal domain-containing protein [Tumidithrix elongata RA019]